jgi:uncharacterized protein YbjT (DUF2867 family)
MAILLLGASGFIGSAIAHALVARGDRVTALGRDLVHGRAVLPDAAWRYGDVSRLVTPEDWRPLLIGVDRIINASGALQTGLREKVGQVQLTAMLALQQAAVAAGVGQFIQISACGAEEQASEFMASKAQADAALRQSGLVHTILRPGLVIGRNGFGGTELLRWCAGLPLVHVDMTGTGAVQCVALVDVVSAVVMALDDPAGRQGQFDLVEREGRTLGQVIGLHRQWLGLPVPRWRIAVPVAALAPVRIVADALGWLGWRSPLRSNSIAALVHGVRGNGDEAARMLGREPLGLPQTLAAMGAAGKADRWHARFGPVYPLALAMLMVLWLGSAVLGVVRLEQAAAELTQAGLASGPAKAVVLGGSLADLAIAIGILFRPTLARALKTGIALSLAYIVGALLLRPDLWLDPLGPMLKVLPIVALMLACLASSEER